MNPLLLGMLENLGLDIRLGVWAILLLTAFYIWRMLNVGSKASNWLVRIAFALVIIATGLASGVLTGVDTGQLMGIVGGFLDLLADIASSVGLLSAVGP